MPGSPGLGTMALASLDALRRSPAGLVARPRAGGLPRRSGQGEKARRRYAPSKPGQTINAALAVPLALAAGRVEVGHVRHHLAFPQRPALPTRRQSLQPPLGRRDRRRRIIWPRTSTPLWERTRLYHDTRLSIEPAGRISGRDDVAERHPARPDLLLVGGWILCRLRGKLRLLPAQLHACVELRPEPRPAVSGRRDKTCGFRTSSRICIPTAKLRIASTQPHGAFIDGHCACIEAAYREYQLSPDKKFLETVWPGVKKAVDWLIRSHRSASTKACRTATRRTPTTRPSPAPTRSSVRSICPPSRPASGWPGDERPAQRRPLANGSDSRHEKPKRKALERRILHPDSRSPFPAEDYDTGCHADQLLGQWWAHMLNLGYLVSAGAIKSALSAVMKYNFREKFAGFNQEPRRYIPDDDGGLIICTWPHGGRPKSVHSLCRRSLDRHRIRRGRGDGLSKGSSTRRGKSCASASSRYDGRLRDGLNSGPRRQSIIMNLECGKFYARAMSFLVAADRLPGLGARWAARNPGFQTELAAGRPSLLLTAPEGWGLFVQQRKAGEQTERIEVRHGQLRLARTDLRPAQRRTSCRGRHHRRPTGCRHVEPNRHGCSLAFGTRGAGNRRFSRGSCDSPGVVQTRGTGVQFNPLMKS